MVRYFYNYYPLTSTLNTQSMVALTIHRRVHGKIFLQLLSPPLNFKHMVHIGFAHTTREFMVRYFYNYNPLTSTLNTQSMVALTIHRRVHGKIFLQLLSPHLNFEHMVHIGFAHTTGEFMVRYFYNYYPLTSTLNTQSMVALTIHRRVHGKIFLQLLSPPLNFEHMVHIGFAHTTGEFMVRYFYNYNPLTSTLNTQSMVALTIHRRVHGKIFLQLLSPPLNFEHTVHVGFDHTTGEFTVRYVYNYYPLTSTLKPWSMVALTIHRRVYGKTFYNYYPLTSTLNTWSMLALTIPPESSG